MRMRGGGVGDIEDNGENEPVSEGGTEGLSIEVIGVIGEEFDSPDSYIERRREGGMMSSIVFGMSSLYSATQVCKMQIVYRFLYGSSSCLLYSASKARNTSGSASPRTFTTFEK